MKNQVAYFATHAFRQEKPVANLNCGLTIFPRLEQYIREIFKMRVLKMITEFAYVFLCFPIAPHIVKQKKIWVEPNSTAKKTMGGRFEGERTCRF